MAWGRARGLDALTGRAYRRCSTEEGAPSCRGPSSPAPLGWRGRVLSEGGPGGVCSPAPSGHCTGIRTATHSMPPKHRGRAGPPHEARRLRLTRLRRLCHRVQGRPDPIRPHRPREQGQQVGAVLSHQRDRRQREGTRPRLRSIRRRLAARRRRLRPGLPRRRLEVVGRDVVASRGRMIHPGAKSGVPGHNHRLIDRANERTRQARNSAGLRHVQGGDRHGQGPTGHRRRP